MEAPTETHAFFSFFTRLYANPIVLFHRRLPSAQDAVTSVQDALLPQTLPPHYGDPWSKSNFLTHFPFPWYLHHILTNSDKKTSLSPLAFLFLYCLPVISGTSCVSPPPATRTVET